MVTAAGDTRFAHFIVAQVHIDVHLVVVLSQRVAHVAFKLRDREEKLELIAAAWHVDVEKSVDKASNETPFVVLDHLVVVIFEELGPEIGQVEASIVVRCKLV